MYIGSSQIFEYKHLRSVPVTDFEIMLMDSSSALRVQEIAGEIENCAFNNVDGMTVKSFYEAALWQCFYMSGVHANIDEIRSRVISTLKKSEKEHAHILAKTVIAYDLSLADILPCTAKEPKKIGNESPRKKIKWRIIGIHGIQMISWTFRAGLTKHKSSTLSAPLLLILLRQRYRNAMRKRWLMKCMQECRRFFSVNIATAVMKSFVING